MRSGDSFVRRTYRSEILSSVFRRTTRVRSNRSRSGTARFIVGKFGFRTSRSLQSRRKKIGLLYEGESLSAKIYPNPAGEKITIEILPEKEIFVRSHLIDIFGETVLYVANGEPISSRKEIVLDLTEISSGSYFLSVSSDEEKIFLPLRVIK